MKHQEAEKKRRLRLWEKNRENIPLKPITPIKNDDQKISAKKTNDLVTVITEPVRPYLRNNVIAKSDIVIFVVFKGLL